MVGFHAQLQLVLMGVPSANVPGVTEWSPGEHKKPRKITRFNLILLLLVLMALLLFISVGLRLSLAQLSVAAFALHRSVEKRVLSPECKYYGIKWWV